MYLPKSPADIKKDVEEAKEMAKEYTEAGGPPVRRFNIKDIMYKLLKDEAWWSEFVYNIKLVDGLPPGVRVPTGAMMWTPQGWQVVLNPDWFYKLPPRHALGFLKHEYLHYIFTHMARRKGRDPELWNVACDAAINCLIPFFSEEFC